jgi:L-fuculose-phosphate aldolase
MDILTAKQTVIDAGKELVKEGLIQRTWGNVSCRISDTQFVITPSGRDYLSLTPDEIVTVNISDCSYEGEVKPSSEKGIHAKCYQLRPEVGFVIHTHQTYASLMGLSGMDVNAVPADDAAVLGDCVPVAAYGLPGTGKLKKGVVDALLRAPQSKACLMLHHGALCVGADMAEAFNVANTLEKVCRERINERFYQISGNTAEGFYSMAAYIAEGFRKGAEMPEIAAFDSVRQFGAIEMTPADGGESIMVDLATGRPLDKTASVPETASLHAAIYNKRGDVNAIVHSKEEATLAASRMGRTVKPFLDDFAQIVGFTLKNAEFDPERAKRSANEVLRKLRLRDAVLLKDNGAICVGADEDEANAVKLVTEKGCKAFTAAEMYGRGRECINFMESALMRVIYKKKYSKKK